MPIILDITLASNSLPVAQRFIQEQFPGAMPDRTSRQANTYSLPKGFGRASASFRGPIFNLADAEGAREVAQRIVSVAEKRGMSVRVHGMSS